MFKIGEFSKLNKISIKTLRHYDKLNLLNPVHVDTESGYRYYSAKQLPCLNRILSLKDIGFSLSQIAYLIDSDIDNVDLIKMLKIRQSEIEENIKSEQTKFTRVESLIKSIEEDDYNMSNYNVIIKKVEPMKIASIRDIIPDYSQQHHLWMEVGEHLKKHNVKIVGPCFVLYYDPGYKESDVDIEIAEPIAASLPETDRIKVKTIQGIDNAACVIHKGPYANLSSAYTALMKWIEENEYKVAGPNRELYLEGEWCTDNPNEYITEIQIPIEKC